MLGLAAQPSQKTWKRLPVHSFCFLRVERLSDVKVKTLPISSNLFQRALMQSLTGRDGWPSLTDETRTTWPPQFTSCWPSMNSHNRKKLTEARYIDALKGVLPVYCEEELCACESPDYLLRRGGRMLGIEITELCVPSSRMPKRQIESIEGAITSMAHRIAVQRKLPPITVSLFFNVHGRMRKPEQKRVAEGVVSAVAELIPPPGGSTRLEFPFSSKSQPREVDLILVSNHERYYKHVWRPIKASWVLQDCVELFQASIIDKSRKYASYRSKCDECWLVLGAEGTKPSSAIRPNEASLAHTYRSAFDRVFFVRLENQQVISLNSTIL